jgi:hypothetical protein
VTVRTCLPDLLARRLSADVGWHFPGEATGQLRRQVGIADQNDPRYVVHPICDLLRIRGAGPGLTSAGRILPQ